MNASLSLWSFLGFWTHLGAAIACTLAAMWALRGNAAQRFENLVMAIALVFTAFWALCVIAFGIGSGASTLAETARNLAWLLVLNRLFMTDGRDKSVGPVRPVIFALAFVEMLHPVLFVIGANYASTEEIAALVFNITAIFRILFVVGALVLLHNLYVGSASAHRAWLRWPTAALGALWIFELNLYTVAYLGDGLPLELATLRGLAVCVMTIPIALGYTRIGQERNFRPSRKIAFQSLSLLVIGLYLLVMVGIAQAIAMVGGDYARLTQVGFVFGASVVAVLWLPSQRLRDSLRVTAVKHLFKHRYDYREEWLRFTRTLAQAEEGGQPLRERLVKAVADITNSPGGLLLTPHDGDGLALSARYKWDGIEVPAVAIDQSALSFFEANRFIVDMDEVRDGSAPHAASKVLPNWLAASQHAWALVPLVHYNHLVGMIVLSRPEDARPLDWEDFDLLRVVGQQLASYLQEQAGQEALNEASRFDEFNRRIAFVMHDIKNLASQLSLLARNAEKHADNPDFRSDMLVTLRNSTDKLNTLLARLNRYRSAPQSESEDIAIVDLVEGIAHALSGAHEVVLVEKTDLTVSGHKEALEQALTHLVQNAIDASEPKEPVYLRVSADGLNALIEVIDSGHGMSPEFLRNKLFRPFHSSKDGGFGIGAYEARELITAMGGRIDVESREDLGTRFFVRLPLSETSMLINTINDRSALPGEEVA